VKALLVSRRSMSKPISPPLQSPDSFGEQVRRAVIWRSASQILAQSVQWAATFLVIRILDPQDYGLFAMTSVMMVFLNMLNGTGLASALIQQSTVTKAEIRQLFGMLLALNAMLAITQFLAAPLAAAYYRQDQVVALLRVQSLLYLTTPFIALPGALLSRAMDFRHQARANIAASFAGASTALAGALLGFGVWTLVAAPLMLLAVRGGMMTLSARSLMWPSFDFRGSGQIARFGGVLAAGQLFWFLQSQADVFIAGRHFSAHELGIYTTSLFLTQIFVAKFVPPLNEVAFSAYARIQHDEAAVARAFVRAAGIVMLVAMPFYVGLAATAEPLVLIALGEKWHEMAPVVRLLALAMPFMTLNVLYTPACDAKNRPGIGVRNGAAGAAILAVCFLVGVRGGPAGLGYAWIVGYPLYLAVSTWRSLPVIGVRLRDLAAAVAPAVLASLAMGLVVRVTDLTLPPLELHARFAALVIVGAVAYAAWLMVFAPATVRDSLAVIRLRRAQAD
jgi:O-antigen/teichoic acid export membrane protein